MMKWSECKMIELKGKYNIAKVFTNNIEETAVNQIIELCDQEFVKGSKIRIMPDTHAGAGCTIGTTMTIQDKVVPNLVGVDIGCGMTVAKLNINAEEINFDKLEQSFASIFQVALTSIVNLIHLQKNWLLIK